MIIFINVQTTKKLFISDINYLQIFWKNILWWKCAILRQVDTKKISFSKPDFRSGQSASLGNFWPGQRWSKSYQKNKIRFRWLNWQSEMNYSFFMNRNFEGSNLFCRVSVIFYFGFATFEIIKSDNRPLTFLPESINHLFFDSKSHFRLKNVLLLNNLTSIF